MHDFMMSGTRPPGLLSTPSHFIPSAATLTTPRNKVTCPRTLPMRLHLYGWTNWWNMAVPERLWSACRRYCLVWVDAHWLRWRRKFCSYRLASATADLYQAWFGCVDRWSAGTVDGSSDGSAYRLESRRPGLTEVERVNELIDPSTSGGGTVLVSLCGRPPSLCWHCRWV